MTSRPGRRRIVGVILPYHRLLEEHIGVRNVSEVARQWDVPRWVLFDGLSESAKMPSLVYAPKIARGMGMTLEEFLEKISSEEVQAAG